MPKTSSRRKRAPAGRTGRPHTCDGFTLIELLVVIAILSVLMTLLIPSLKGARELARLAVCAGNLRAQHVAIATYEMTYNTFMGPDGNGYDWQEIHGISLEVGRCPSTPEVLPWPFGNKSYSTAGVTSYVMNAYPPSTPPAGRIGYGLSPWIRGPDDDLYKLYSGGFHPKHRARLHNSDMIIVADQARPRYG